MASVVASTLATIRVVLDTVQTIAEIAALTMIAQVVSFAKRVSADAAVLATIRVVRDTMRTTATLLLRIAVTLVILVAQPMTIATVIPSPAIHASIVAIRFAVQMNATVTRRNASSLPPGNTKWAVNYI